MRLGLLALLLPESAETYGRPPGATTSRASTQDAARTLERTRAPAGAPGRCRRGQGALAELAAAAAGQSPRAPPAVPGWRRVGAPRRHARPRVAAGAQGVAGHIRPWHPT